MREVAVGELKQALEDMHNCRATEIEAVSVTETFEDNPVWQGTVHVFSVEGHPKATRAYAWSSPIEGTSKRRFFAVLHIPPIDSPIAAVRAAIIAEHRAKEE